MYVFDSLIYNTGRSQDYMVYETFNWSMLLIIHVVSFGTRGGRPPYLSGIDIKIGDSWVEALRGLSDDVIQAELGDVLDKRRIKALGKRRDQLIEDATGE